MSTMKNNNTSNWNYNSNNPNTQNNSYQHHDRRRPTQHQSHQQPQQYQRERSGQRNQGAQHPDSSMGRDNSTNLGNQSNLGSIRFQPGFPTRELPPIETKADPNKKFTGRCRLFVGNLPHNTTEEKLRNLFESYGEVGEVFLGPKSAFAFIKMDTRHNAESARNALDCSMYEGRTLRVRLAAHAAAIRVKHLSSQVTNELLAYAFRYFGEIERAVVVVDDKGKSIGEGVVEYSKKQSALYAIKRCQQECFMLTASPKPVLVEPFDQQDEDEGMPEKSINKNSIDFKEQREVGPRFADQGTFEHTFALKWKELYEVEKQKRDRLEQEIQEARKSLQDQIEYSRLEHDTIQLRSRLQQLEDDRLKLQQLKDQTINGAQQREELRRQQDMLIRQREEEVLRRQQLGDISGINQQETALRMQANALQDLLNNPTEHQSANEESADPNLPQQKSQATGSQLGLEVDPNMPINQMTMMPSHMPNQMGNFTDSSMLNLNHQSFVSVQQSMGMHPQNPQLNPPNMFTPYMPPQHQIPLDVQSNANMICPPSASSYPMQSSHQPSLGVRRHHKYSRQYNNNNNNSANSSGTAHTGGNNGGRQRKRGRF